METGRTTPAALSAPRQDPACQGSYEYRLLGTDGLAVGELSELLARHRRDGWEVDRLLVSEAAGARADMTDLQDLGILLRRRRRT
jgi:hypothetical protein